MCKLLKNEEGHADKDELEKLQAVMYALAVKFLVKSELNEVKEVLKMTILGEMIREDALREGRNAGREEGRKEGGLYKMVSLICKKMRKGQNAAQIAEALEEEVSYVERICEAAGQYAPEYEVEEVYKEIKQLFRNWD